MIRVVADTNIYVSAFMFGGLPGLFLDLALQRTFTLLTTPILLDELDEKLRRKFEVKLEDAALILRKLESIAELVEPNLFWTSSKMPRRQSRSGVCRGR